MSDTLGPAIDILFTLIVFVAVLALLTREYAEWVVLAATLLVIWQAVQFFGPSVFLATFIILIFAAVRAVVMLLGSDGIDQSLTAPILDELLTRDETEQHASDRQPREQRKDNDH